MQGQEVTRRYFFEWALPYLQDSHPALVDRVAAGMIGGSDSIGADDAISRDHNWGPGFSLWLTEKDFAARGADLAADLHQAVPDAFAGFEVAACFGSKAQSIRVGPLDAYFEEETGGHRQMPDDPSLWNPTLRDESHLYFLKHGQVFHDPLGEFSRRRAAFVKWPRPVLLQRMGNAAWQLWHYGEYNFSRVARRDDRLAVLFCKAEFIRHAMRLCFYLEEDFVPYWKWTAHCFRQIKGIGPLADLLDRFHATTDFDEEQRLIASICADLCARVVEKGYVAEDDGPLAIYTQLEEAAKAS